jgi:hypothetical protein
MTRDRIYQNNDGEWFYSLRGDADAGPYASFELAESALHLFVQRKRALLNGLALRARWRAVKQALRKAPARSTRPQILESARA